MALSQSLRFIFGITLVVAVAADSGDDFSNNLFSDLAPLLALFGEQVAKQFMSQSTGWADNFIFAMAPLGILTAIVGAIRVGGPTWLKAIIGRARENRAVAEQELMSSTSSEVCELWNRQQVVRLIGSAPIRQFILLVPCKGSSGTSKDLSKPKLLKLDSGIELKGQDVEKYLEMREPDILHVILPTIIGAILNELREVKEWIRQRWANFHTLLITHQKELEHDLEAHKRSGSDQSGDARSGNDQNADATPGDGHGADTTSNIDADERSRNDRRVDTDHELDPNEFIIITDSSIAPNVSLNLHDHSSRRELRVVAIFGTVLQLGVLMASGFITYYPRLMLQKGGFPVRDYAFPLTAIGTLILVAGMLICSHIVEGSTVEIIYQVKNPAMEARVLWLQRAETVSDQSFESYAIAATDARRHFMTSQRRKPGDTADTSSEILTIIGTAISLCGFIVQFVGLRGMHWSATIMQLGATLLMTAMRALVRRGLAGRPYTKKLVPDYELDWLATEVEKNTDLSWLDPPGKPKPHQGESATKPCAWKLNFTTRKPSNDSETRQREPTTEPGSTLSEKFSEPGQEAMKIRASLGKLTKWHGPEFDKAISVKKSIEAVLTALSDLLPGEVINWTFGPPEFEELEKLNLKPFETQMINSTAPQIQKIEFKAELKNKKWEIDVNEIEAALSLCHFAQKPAPGQSVAENSSTQLQEGQLRHLGPYTKSLHRDLKWWMVGDTIRIKVTVKRRYLTVNEEYIDLIEEETDFISEERDFSSYLDHVWGTVSHTSLSDRYAQEMFSAFMKAVAKELKSQLTGNVDLGPARNPTKWQSFTLHSVNLLKIAQDVQRTGLGSLEEAYLSIIPHLSIEGKLPKTDAVIELAREQTKEHELLGHWEEVGKIYLWLFKNCITFGARHSVAVKATVVLVEFLRSLDLAIEKSIKQLYDEYSDIKPLKGLRSRIIEEIKRADDTILSDLVKILDKQGRRIWKVGKIEERFEVRFDFNDADGVENVGDDSHGGEVVFDNLLGYQELHERAGLAIDSYNDYRVFEDAITRTEDPNLKDTFCWTPLHYALAKGHIINAERLLKRGADINAKDLVGWTPFHYACYRDEESCGSSIISKLLQHVADVGIQGRDRVAPLHCAAMKGHLDVVKLLVEAGADVNVLDASRNTPLHCAASNGHVEVTRFLLQETNKRLREHKGRTPLHLGAIGGHLNVLNLFKDGDATWESKDRLGQTALSLAATSGRKEIVELLLANKGAKGVDVNSKDNNGKTPLSWAAEYRQEEVARLLLDRGADVNSKDNDDITPLSWAAENGQEEVARLFLDRGADIESKDNNGQTPLSWAAENGHKEVVSLLLDRGADVNSKDNDGITPLSLAIKYSWKDVFRLLLDRGADIESEGKDGRTPLSHATRMGHAGVVKLLLRNGAKVESKDKDGHTPLWHATNGSHDAIIKLLTEASTSSTT